MWELILGWSSILTASGIFRVVSEMEEFFRRFQDKLADKDHSLGLFALFQNRILKEVATEALQRLMRVTIKELEDSQ